GRPAYLSRGVLQIVAKGRPIMVEIPERLRHLLDRQGLLVVGHAPMITALRAVHKSVPTMQKAAQLVDGVLERLGGRAFIDPSFAQLDYERHVYLADAEHPGWFFGAPILEHRFVNRVVVDENGKRIEPKPSADVPDIVPTGPLMRAGDLVLREGA